MKKKDKKIIEKWCNRQKKIIPRLKDAIDRQVMWSEVGKIRSALLDRNKVMREKILNYKDTDSEIKG